MKKFEDVIFYASAADKARGKQVLSSLLGEIQTELDTESAKRKAAAVKAREPKADDADYTALWQFLDQHARNRAAEMVREAA